MRNHRAALTTVGLLAAATVLACGCEGRPRRSLKAGGSTFAYPMMSHWAGEYQKEHGVELRYLAFGSGKGVEEMINHTLDFGCTDAPLTDKDIEAARAAGGEVVHVPLMLGAVVPAYNLPDVKEPLRFSGQVLAEIYLGAIRRWNDPALAHLNPDVKLPDQPIAVVHRLDSSGTTAIWTEYLTRMNPEWKSRVGAGRTVPWPAGTPAPGNDGVAGAVQRTPGAIGYVELNTALQEALAVGLVQNREGRFVKPSPVSVTAAAEAALKEVPEDLRFSIVNAPGPDSYPISGATWAVLYTEQPKEKAALVTEFLRWATHEGQKHVAEMSYATLPSALVSRAEGRIAAIKATP